MTGEGFGSVTMWGFSPALDFQAGEMQFYTICCNE